MLLLYAERRKGNWDDLQRENTVIYMDPRTALKRERQNLEDRTQQRLSNERAQAIAFERLVSLLEADGGAVRRESPMSRGAEQDNLSRLARLRAAHAAYALATTGEMKRMGQGAWVRRIPC